MSFPDFIPSFTIKQDMDELALSLALSVLSMSKSEFNSMSIQDIKQHYSTFNQDHRLAYEILLCYKSRHENHVRYSHNLSNRFRYRLSDDPHKFENMYDKPWEDPEWIRHNDDIKKQNKNNRRLKEDDMLKNMNRNYFDPSLRFDK